MAKRKITKADVNAAYNLANEAKADAANSCARARQLKDGADKLNAEYKRNAAKNKASKTKRTPRKHKNDGNPNDGNFMFS